MDISVSKAKNTKKVHQRALNLELQILEPKCQNLLREKQGNQEFTLRPLPSSPPLQGGRGFSCSSSKLSSLEGVWQPRKGEKMRETGAGKGKAESFPSN